MPAEPPPPSAPQEDLLSRAVNQTAQLATQLRADAAALDAAKFDSAAGAVAGCAVAAGALSEALRESGKRIS